MLRLYRFLSRFLDLDDVSATAPTDGQVYAWDAANAVLAPQTLTDITVLPLTLNSSADNQTLDASLWGEGANVVIAIDAGAMLEDVAALAVTGEPPIGSRLTIVASPAVAGEWSATLRVSIVAVTDHTDSDAVYSIALADIEAAGQAVLVTLVAVPWAEAGERVWIITNRMNATFVEGD